MFTNVHPARRKPRRMRRSLILATLISCCRTPPSPRALWLQPHLFPSIIRLQFSCVHVATFVEIWSWQEQICGRHSGQLSCYWLLKDVSEDSEADWWTRILNLLSIYNFIFLNMEMENWNFRQRFVRYGGRGVPPVSVKKCPLTFQENLVRGGTPLTESFLMSNWRICDNLQAICDNLQAIGKLW